MTAQSVEAVYVGRLRAVEVCLPGRNVRAVAGVPVTFTLDELDRLDRDDWSLTGPVPAPTLDPAVLVDGPLPAVKDRLAGADRPLLEAVLAVEREGRARKSLITWLEQRATATQPTQLDHHFEES